jgi:GNAT superfamily N-acetyltransferase
MMTTKRQAQFHISETLQFPDLAFRHYLGKSDLPKMLALSNLVNQADQTGEVETLEQLTHHYKHLKNCDPYKDVLIAEVDGYFAAYCRVWWDIEGENTYIYRSFGNIHPDWRRKGLGTALLSYNQNHLRNIAQENAHPKDAPRFFESWSGSTMIGATVLLKSHGYEAVRYFFEMIRSINTPLPESPLPAGLVVRPFDESHNRPIWEAFNEAFRDHWGYVEGTEEDFQRFLTRPTRKPHLWKVAWDGEQVAGLILNSFFEEEDKVFNRKRGWTDPICVRSPWRRRGLARSLIAQSILMFKDMGFDDTALGVDTNNPNGALNLYEGLGYKTAKTWVSYRKKMP